MSKRPLKWTPPDVGGADERQVGGKHYKDMGVQPWDVMQAVLTPEEFRGFLRGNAIKYLMREGHKEGSDDIAKALHYLQKIKELDEELHKMPR